MSHHFLTFFTPSFTPTFTPPPTSCWPDQNVILRKSLWRCQEGLQPEVLDLLHLRDKICMIDKKPENVLFCKVDNANPIMQTTKMYHSKLVDLGNVWRHFVVHQSPTCPVGMDDSTYTLKMDYFTTMLVKSLQFFWGLHCQPEREKDHHSWITLPRRIIRMRLRRSVWTKARMSGQIVNCKIIDSRTTWWISWMHNIKG